MSHIFVEMLHIGLTGGIGSGKSTVARVFETLGIPVFYADMVAKRAYLDPEIQDKVSELLHIPIIKNGVVQREEIAAIIFNDESKLVALNAIIHPWVAQEYRLWCNQQRHHHYVVREAAILIESGAYTSCDKIILITAPIEQRINRVMKRDGVQANVVLSRIEQQMSDEERAAYANYIWKNDNSFPLLEHILLFDNMIKA